MAEFENKTIADLLARAKRAAAEAKDYDVEKPNISFVELLQNDEAWTVVTTLANKGYRGQPLTQKLNAVFELPEDGGLTRAAVTKAIRTEAWRRQDAAEKSGNAAIRDAAMAVAESLGLRSKPPRTPADDGQTASQGELARAPEKHRRTRSRRRKILGGAAGDLPATEERT